MKTTITAAVAMAFSAIAFANTPTINGEPVTLTADSHLYVDRMADCTTYECMMDRSDVQFITSNYRDITVIDQIDAIIACDFARELGIEDEVIITLNPVDGSDVVVVGKCKVDEG